VSSAGSAGGLAPCALGGTSVVEEGVQTQEKVYDHEEIAQALQSIAERVAAQTREQCTREFKALLDELRRSNADLHGAPVFAVGDKVAVKGSSEYRRGNYKDGEGWGEVVKVLTTPIKYVVTLKCHKGVPKSEAVEDWFHAEELIHANS